MVKWDRERQKSFRQIYAYSCICWYIQAYSGIFRHNQAYSGIIQGCWSIFRSLSNPGIFRTMLYSEPWHIQKTGIFGTLVYSEFWYIQNSGKFRTLVYSETWYIQNSSIFITLTYSEPWYIQKPSKFRTWNIFATLSNIRDRASYENNANSFLHFFEISLIPNLARPVVVTKN